jgi:hypothetical protein
MNEVVTLDRPWNLLEPAIEEVQQARERISKDLRPTPLLENERVNDLLGRKTSGESRRVAADRQF